MTPAPWVNVISNPEFGFLITESGGGYTWCENSREYKLSPWSNDPVSDSPGEVFYLTKEGSEAWSITPLPVREEEPYLIRHGFGYTVFEHESHGILQRITQFVPVEGTLKISIISLEKCRRSRLCPEGHILYESCNGCHQKGYRDASHQFPEFGRRPVG